MGLRKKTTGPAPLCFLFGGLLLLCAACTTGQGGGQGGDNPFDVEADVIEFELPDGRQVRLGADWVRSKERRGPASVVIFVPGSGRISRRGEQRGDGQRSYPTPVDVTALWVSTAAETGFDALTYDKRTCTSKNHPGCNNNPDSDLKVQGPVALAADVDAACAHAQQERNLEPGRLILVAQNQAAQVVLSSKCAARAGALILLAPIPGSVDEVMVEGMLERAGSHARAANQAKDASEKNHHQKASRKLTNQAESLRETFSSMLAGRFPPEAEVMGTPVDFWLGWIALTAETPELLLAHSTPTAIVMGGQDTQYARAHKTRLSSWAKKAGARVFNWPKADHHLLNEVALKRNRAAALWKWAHETLSPPPAQGGGGQG
jgi:alpha-beta hydrolase superfamily lysophospholipase